MLQQNCPSTSGTQYSYAFKSARVGSRRSNSCCSFSQERKERQEFTFVSRAGPVQAENAEGTREKRETKSKAFGEWLIETTHPEDLEQPAEDDFWSGPQWNIVGKTAGFAIPVIIVLLILTGFVAAGSYMDGATSALQQPGSTEESAKILPFPGTESED